MGTMPIGRGQAKAIFDARLKTSHSPEYLASKRALALRRWFVALSQRATATADIWTITDSIFEGNGLTSYLGRLPYLALTKLRTNYPTAGIAGGLGYIAPYMATSQTADWPVVNTGGSGLTQGYGLGTRGRLWSATGNKSVFSFSGATHVGVLYYRVGTGGAAGHFTYQIDAGATTDVNCQLSTASDFIEIVITIPDTGAHTVTVAWVSGSVIFDGFMHYNQDSTAGGIRLWEGGHGGGDCSTFMGDATHTLLLGNQATRIQADVVVVELFANDFTGTTPVSAATASTRLDTIISTVRANTTIAPSIVLIPVWELHNANTPLDLWSTFVNVLYAKADADAAICVLDFQQRVKTALGSSDTGQGILSNAEGTWPSHPNDQGAAYLAEVLARFLSPQ